MADMMTRRARKINEAIAEPSVIHEAQERGMDYGREVSRPRMTPEGMAAYDAETERLRKEIERKKKEEASWGR